jgi:DNA-binding transcriptional MerR regulator/methylmalonyl-CoA mutase cobalamin-binding subunit
MTGVPADTFRAWERRYGFPRPFRTPANQRLYTEQDIGIITWLRNRTDDGMTISHAVQRLKLEAPEVFAAPQTTEPARPPQDRESQTDRLQQRLLDAMTAFDDVAAERAIDDALARFSVDAFCERFIEPAIEAVEQRRRHGNLNTGAWYFATRLLERRLVSLLAMVAPRSGRGTIVVASPPGEEHEVGLLVLAIVLARRGWKVVYLGRQIPTDVLVDVTHGVRPDVVCFSTSTDYAASQAEIAAQALAAGIGRTLPVVVGRTTAEVIGQLADVIDHE